MGPTIHIGPLFFIIGILARDWGLGIRKYIAFIFPARRDKVLEKESNLNENSRFSMFPTDFLSAYPLASYETPQTLWLISNE